MKTAHKDQLTQQNDALNQWLKLPRPDPLQFVAYTPNDNVYIVVGNEVVIHPDAITCSKRRFKVGTGVYIDKCSIITPSKEDRSTQGAYWHGISYTDTIKVKEFAEWQRQGLHVYDNSKIDSLLSFFESLFVEHCGDLRTIKPVTQKVKEIKKIMARDLLIERGELDTPDYEF